MLLDDIGFGSYEFFFFFHSTLHLLVTVLVKNRVVTFWSRLKNFDIE